jgi:spore coat protein U-like protein
MMRALAVTAFLLLACCTRQAAAQSYCTGYASTLSFGSSVTGSITVICSSGLAYHVGLSAGYGSGATTTTRVMNSGQMLLNYKLFKDTARAINWGNSSPSDTLNGTGTNSAQTLTVYATVPAGQYVAPGAYTDTITVTVSSSASPSSFQFGVNATPASSCAVSATAMSFGAYSRTLINSTSTITATCSNTTAYNIGLGAGLGSGATVTSRKMTSPAKSTLNYTLFRNSARTQNWGSTIGTDTVSGTGTGTAQSLTVYGRIAAGQAGNPGTYTDTITATITY